MNHKLVILGERNLDTPPILTGKKVHSEKFHLHKIVEKGNSAIVTYQCLPEGMEQERMVEFGVENTERVMRKLWG